MGFPFVGSTDAVIDIYLGTVQINLPTRRCRVAGLDHDLPSSRIDFSRLLARAHAPPARE